MPVSPGPRRTPIRSRRGYPLTAPGRTRFPPTASNAGVAAPPFAPLATAPTFRRRHRHRPNRTDNSDKRKVATARGKPGKNESTPARRTSPGLNLLRKSGARLLRKQAQDFLRQALEPDSGNGLARIQHNVPSPRNDGPVQPKDLPQATLHPVAEHRVPQAARRRDAQPRVGQAIGSEKKGE